MIACCVLHMLRVLLQAAYKRPRELTWIIGVVLLALTMGFGFTGYLLPWDQRAYWATTVGTEIAGSVPLVGGYLQRLLRGGDNLSGTTLSRFYGIHTLVLPLGLALFVAIHLLLIHQQGLAPGPRDEDEEADS
jgi:quinol-cytochrome oxidoreductase complex cytochrome b subunit